MELNLFEILEYLPGLNCKNCGERTCMSFADKLAKGEKTMAACAPLREEGYKKRRIKLKKLLDEENNG